MGPEGRWGRRRRRATLAAILVFAAAVGLHRIGAPLLDAMAVKQVYVANKARNIARTPFDPMRNTLDFLDERGGPMVLTEEVPLYTTVLGLGFRLVGERAWVGRLLSLAATLAAIAAFFDLARRETDDREAAAATLLFASCPLLIFYGRAVMPDSAMLAGMLLAACAYRRRLDGGGPAWTVAAALAALTGALFKYYGLMVLLPLAAMAHRRGGWRAVLRGEFLMMAALVIAPVALWMGLVFARTPNPTGRYPYFIVQEPGLVLRGELYARWFSRFLYRDCGPVATALMALGGLSALRGRRGAPLAGWTIMGLAFYVLMGPKLRDHDYYELMMLPAAAAWAGRGWARVRALGRPEGAARRGRIALAAAVILQGPWIMASKFEPTRGHAVLADRLARLSPPGARVVVVGPGLVIPVVHLCGRPGWALHAETLPPGWPAALDDYRDRGAALLAVVFEPTATPAERASYAPLRAALPEVERRVGPWARFEKPYEYTIYNLRSGESGGPTAEVTGAAEGSSRRRE